ncbi:MAG: phosphoenolpyruvate--protein phosphotransferase [Sutterella sp.]|nr:phosphoenolpyruvate--protein phosphotransferase [Sutterella sp.]
MADPIRTTPDREDDLLTAESAVRELHGISVFPGTAYGLCQLFGSGDLEVPQFSIEKTATRGEIQRLRAAISTVDKQLAALIRSDDEELPPEAVAFVDVHRTILGDPTLIEDTVEIIKEKLVNAEWALSIRLEKTRRDFESIEDDYIRERVKDIAQVISRVQRVLTGRRSPASLFEAEGYEEKIILVADQLDPADMLLLRGRDDLDLAGIVLEEGSTTCHAAILARSLEIPTLVGVKRARELLQNDQSVLLDADSNTIELFPTAERRRDARLRMRELAENKKQLKKLRTLDAVTLDGQTIHLYANIALPEDVRDVHRAGADGVGLFRTEFLFMNRNDLPSEDEQFEAYSKVIRSMKGRPVVIRTADLGGDKMLSRQAFELLSGDVPEEMNPSLGLRALRFSFAYPSLLITQLKAIFRAASIGTGNVKILLPMVTCPEDVEMVLEFIEAAKHELEEAGTKYSESVPLGGMIELPAAVVMLKDLIPVLDFFSLGTNDLVQYTLAVDRTNAAVSRYYDECHPSVLRLIADTVRRVHQAGKSISVCGEMAGRREMIPFFIGLGCTSLSMTLTQIPAIKKRILQTDLAQSEAFASSVLRKRSLKTVHQSFELMEDTFRTKNSV